MLAIPGMGMHHKMVIKYQNGSATGMTTLRLSVAERF
jgi:hypothetical protein